MQNKKYLEQAEEEYDAAFHLYDGGFYRDAVSRAYFSMVHSAQSLLITKNIRLKSHKTLIKRFGEEFIKKEIIEKKMGNILFQVETIRAKADYDIGVKITKKKCEKILDSCELFISEIKRIIKELQIF